MRKIGNRFVRLRPRGARRQKKKRDDTRNFALAHKTHTYRLIGF
jgi:hypothetical protein